MMAERRGHGAEEPAAAKGQLLNRLRQRCKKLQRLAERNPGGSAWARWSKAINERNALFAEIAAIPLRTLADVAIRYEALAMELIDEDLTLDETALRRVAILRRDLRKLASSARRESPDHRHKA